MGAKRWVPRTLSDIMGHTDEPFIEQCARQDDISLSEARDRFAGLKQFLYVCAVTPGSQVAPLTVGPSWQQFLASTKNYRQFCHTNFGRFIEHRVVEAPSGAGYLATRRAAEGVLGSLDETLWPSDGSGASRHASDLD